MSESDFDIDKDLLIANMLIDLVKNKKENNELKSKIDSLLIRKDQLMNDNANLRLIIHKIKDTVQEFALSGLIENYPTLSDRIEDIK